MSLKSLVLLGLAAACIQAQNLGRVSGSVNDPTGAPVPSASVTLSMPGSTKAQFETRTTNAGTFTLPGLRPGE